LRVLLLLLLPPLSFCRRSVVIGTCSAPLNVFFYCAYCLRYDVVGWCYRLSS
jgi:hypothetical protein